MKSVRVATAALLLLFTATCAFAQFEGIAEFKGTMVTERGETLPAQGKFFLTKNAFRMDWQMDMKNVRAQGEKASPGLYKMTIMQKLSQPDRMVMLNDKRKTYSVINLKKASEQAVAGEKFTVKKLGRDRLGGLSCEKAVLTSSSNLETEVCVTRELVPSSAWLDAMDRQNSRHGIGRALRENGLDGFPVRWITRRKGSIEPVSTLELTRFQKTSVPSSTFEIPAGYREISATGTRTPEQEKARKEALQKMTPEQRKRYEEMNKKP